MSYTALKYGNAVFFPPVDITAETGGIVFGIFKKLQEKEAGLTAEKIYNEIRILSSEAGYIFERVVFDAAVHDPKYNAKFPIVWDTAKNTGLADKQKRAVAVSPSTKRSGYPILSLSPNVVVVGYEHSTRTPFMVLAAKEIIVQKDEKFLFDNKGEPIMQVPVYMTETLVENLMDVAMHPTEPGYRAGLLYHQAVDHLMKKCTANHEGGPQPV